MSDKVKGVLFALISIFIIPGSISWFFDLQGPTGVALESNAFLGVFGLLISVVYAVMAYRLLRSKR